MTANKDGDDSFLRSLGITPEPDLTNYKQKRIEDRMNTLFANPNTTDDINNEDFAYFDEHPEEDPFVEAPVPEPHVNVDYPLPTDDQYKMEVVKSLADAIAEYLVFYSASDLLFLAARALTDDDNNKTI